MPRVECYIEDTLIEVRGKTVCGISLTCGFCDHCVEVPGEDSPELRTQALELLKQGCEDPHLRHIIPVEELPEKEIPE